MPTCSIEHIEVDGAGTARIAGKRIRVTHLAIETRSGLTPTQIQDQYPALTLAEIHAGLAYYYDHQVELDSQIEHELSVVDAMRKQNGNPFTREELLRRKSHAAPEAAE